MRGGCSVGSVWPRKEESTVMTQRAEKAAEKTRRGGCFMAIRQATRKVLSPISEKRIMVRERMKEWKGWMRPLASGEGTSVVVGVLGATLRGSSLEEPGGDGWGMSWGFSGRSSGF